MSSSNTKVALLCAYTLARAGQYGEAEALILSDGELAKTAEAMDLLARIRAEQGDVAEARRLWQEIQLRHPEHQPSREALKNLGRAAFPFPWKAMCLLLAPLTLGMGMVIGALLRSPPETWEKTWGGIPRQVELDELQAHRGRVDKVLLSSGFFADPARVTNRALLSQMVAEALNVPEQAIFIGAGEGEEIRVRLLEKQ